MKLDPWQKEFLEFRGDSLCCTGRRVGKTYIHARKAIERLKETKGLKIVVVSLTEDQAQLIIAMALNYAAENCLKLIGKGKYKPTQNKIYINGGTMTARPVGQTGDSIRSFDGDVLIIDEASRAPKTMWLAARPILLTSGKAEIWMCSTPFGKQGYFWEKFKEAEIEKDPKARFRVFYTSSEKVMREREICDTWTVEQRDGALKALEQERKDMSEIEYGQEFMGLFLEDLRQFFSDELIDKCCTLKRSAKQGFRTYLGCDLARLGGDSITWEVIEKLDSNHYEQRESIVKTKMLTPEVVSEIVQIAKIWDVTHIGIDAGAGTLGVAVLDYLLRTDMRRKVIALNNRDISLEFGEEADTQRMLKEDMYFKLRAMLEMGAIRLLDDPDLKLSLKSIQMEFLLKDNNKPRCRVFSNFGHIAEGIVRAAWLASEDKRLKLWMA